MLPQEDTGCERGVTNVARVEELEMAVDALPKEEYRRFRRWFLSRDWDKWDEEIEEDSKTGSLDFLVREAVEARQDGKLRDL
jgi:hypothetical protein